MISKDYLIASLEDINALLWKDKTLDAKGVVCEVLKYLSKLEDKKGFVYEEGSKYRTKTGAVAFISCVDKEQGVMFGIVQGCSDSFCWTVYGKIEDERQQSFNLTKECVN